MPTNKPIRRPLAIILLILLLLTACAPDNPEATQIPIARVSPTYTAVPTTTSSAQTPNSTTAVPTALQPPTATQTAVPTALQPPTTIPLPLPPLVPFPTVTPDYQVYPTKSVFLYVGGVGGDGGTNYDTYYGRGTPWKIIYGDGHYLIQEDETFHEAFLTPDQMCILRDQIAATGFLEPHQDFFTETEQSDGVGDINYRVESTFYSFYGPDIKYLVEDLAAGVDIIQNYNPPGSLTTYVPDYLIIYIEETEVTESDEPMAWPGSLLPLQELWPEQARSENQHEILVEGEMVIPVYDLFARGMSRRVFIENETAYALIARPILPHETPLRFHYNLPGLPLDYVPVVQCENQPAFIPPTQPTATPTTPQTALTGQGRIVFVAGTRNDSEIYLSEADDTNRLQLTNNRFYDGEPVWSPDGRYIAFTSERSGNIDIFVMEANGRNVTQLTNNESDDYSPAWSPDGTKIVFSSDRNGGWANADIFLMNADGSYQTPIIDDIGRDIFPVWSPDNNKIAYIGETGTAGLQVRTQVKVFDLQSGLVQELFSYSTFTTPRMSWSPDSLELVIGVAANTDTSTIRFFNLEGRETDVITLPEIDLPGSMDWSADGRFIIFSARQPNTGPNAIHYSEDQSYYGNWNLYALDTTTNQIIQITYNQQNETAPSWWP